MLLLGLCVTRWSFVRGGGCRLFVFRVAHSRVLLMPGCPHRPRALARLVFGVATCVSMTSYGLVG